jgi:glutathione S-transferase
MDAVHVALSGAKLTVSDIDEVLLVGGATRTPDFLKLNPNGHIPVVDDHGVIVWESMACALYLAQRYPLPGGGSLAGSTPAEQADVLRWTFWAVTECEKDALAVLMHTAVMPEDRRKPELAQEAGARAAQAAARPARRGGLGVEAAEVGDAAALEPRGRGG